MIELRHIFFTIQHEGEERHLLNDVSFCGVSRHFMAVVGPSGCGKSTLLKVVAGIHEESSGQLFWQGRDLVEEEDLKPAELGYVPQFSIAYEHLTVEESVHYGIRLRIDVDEEEQEEILDYVLKATGLVDIQDRYVKVLSGGQRRRLGLAMELVSDPNVLLCDEVTSGLDPKSEKEVVRLLHDLSRESPERVVMNVTHSLSNLELYDSVLVMYQGVIAFHGPPSALCHYFQVAHPEEIYPGLTMRTAEDWKVSWEKYRPMYYRKFKLGPQNLDAVEIEETESAPDEAKQTAEPGRVSLQEEMRQKVVEFRGDAEDTKSVEEEILETEPLETPGFFSQLGTLLGRRWKIFFRDRTQLFLHLAMLAGFPLLVVIFALNGVDPVETLSQRKDLNPIERISEETSVAAQQMRTGSLVSGLMMFQVILLTLMGANNSAREIASERLILEKEKLGGVRPLSYIASKAVFLAVLVVVQASWMAFFVEKFCKGGLPGDFVMRLALLAVVTAAMTAVCLGLSAISRTPEQSTLLSIYLVGFQLPLSGAVLRLPEFLEPIVQPFIAAFWSWSGILRSLEGTDYYSAVKTVTSVETVVPSLALFVLCLHILVGLLIAWVGVKRSRWDG